MPQAYSNPKRESDPHALPDLEVFYAEAGELGDVSDGEQNEAGWYWWPCFPGCLPDSDPIGPFASKDEALADARQSSGFCEHGIEEDEICQECPAPELWTLQRKDGGCLVFTTVTNPADKAYCSCWGTEAAAKGMAELLGVSQTYYPVRLSDDAARAWGR